MFRDAEPRKVHLWFDQDGAKIAGTSRLFANTLCKMNSDVPESHITHDPAKVTCKICRKDARFRVLINTSFGKLGQGAGNVNEAYGKHAYYPEAIYMQMAGRALRPGVVNGMRTRHRRNWRGKLILQVEETFNNADDRDPRDLGQTVTRWRDATLEDMGGGVV